MNLYNTRISSINHRSKMNFVKTCLFLSTNFVLIYGGPNDFKQFKPMSLQSGPVGPITVYSLGECDPAINNLDLSFEISGEGDDKSVKIHFKIPEDYGKDVEVTLVADKWENNDWRKEMYSMDGKLFDMMSKYFPKIWKNFRSAASPPILAEDKISAGEYTLANYQDTYENIEMPQIMYGRFKIEVTVSLNDEDIACAQAEIEAFEP